MASRLDDSLADLPPPVRRPLGRRRSSLWRSVEFPRQGVVYAAEAAALAVLEVRVHLDLDWSLCPRTMC